MIYCTANRVIACTSFLAFAAGFAGSASADCATRHFYNKSTSPFEIGIASPGTCSISPAMQPTCTVPAGGSAELHYPNGPHGAAAIAVRSADGGLIFPLTSFSVTIGPGTCHINHQQSNTGNIVVNSDADGDITTCGSSYQCAPPPKNAVKIP
jgi:hypothetical protein